ncbi:MAG: alanine racemase [Salibacteraceae bacterium]
MYNPSKIVINKSALETNLNFIRSWIGKRKLSCVVKGNAYGHGIETYIPLAENCGVDHFSVFSADEAVRVKAASNSKPDIAIMGWLDNASMEWAITEDISFWVFDRHRLEMAIETATKLGLKARIHLELETGMNRTGFEENDLSSVIQSVTNNRNQLVVEGICTHFAGAESISNFYRIERQIEKYGRMAAQLKNAGITPRYEHTCCSAAALRFPHMMLDLVRIGILQYGFWPSQEVFIEYSRTRDTHEEPLKRLISWQSEVISIKHIAKGEYIGYGTSFLAQRDMQIGIVPVGYAHGFSRALSNQGRAIVNGTRVAVLGTVNMNSIAIDISEASQTRIGDRVTLIGKEGDVEISVASFSEASNQLNYELLTRLPADIPRTVEL